MTMPALAMGLANVILVVTAAVLVYVAATDLKHYRIRNELIVLLAGLFVLHALLSGHWMHAAWNVGFAAFVLAFLIYFYSQRWMGGGDVKLLTVAFLWAGVECALPFTFLLLLFASLHSVAARFGFANSQQAGSDTRQRIAFAPSVAAGLIAVFMLGCL